MCQPAPQEDAHTETKQYRRRGGGCGRGSPADVCTEAQRVTDPGSCHRGGDLGTACPQPVSPDEETGLTVQRADLTKHWACHLASLSLSVPKSKAKGLHQVISRESNWHYFILWRPVIKTCHSFLPLKRSVDTMALGGGGLRSQGPSALQGHLFELRSGAESPP